MVRVSSIVRVSSLDFRLCEVFRFQGSLYDCLYTFVAKVKTKLALLLRPLCTLLCLNKMRIAQIDVLRKDSKGTQRCLTFDVRSVVLHTSDMYPAV